MTTIRILVKIQTVKWPFYPSVYINVEELCKKALGKIECFEKRFFLDIDV